MKVAIIGGGPIGCYSGYLLASNGHEVTIYEEHKTIGSPIQCTGLLTSEFDTFHFPMDSFLVNTFQKVSVNTKNTHFTIDQKEYLVCRTKFDQFFAQKAQNAGATIYTSHSFLRKEGNELIIKDIEKNTEKRITPDIVIAADGPLSKTLKAYNFYESSRKQYYGIQAVVQGDFSSKQFDTYFGKEICPDLFIWVVPESATIARVGLASKKNTRKLFDTFMKKHNYTAIEIQAGTIPIYNPKQQVHKDNCYAVGDAATQVKATTLGGLVPGLRAAEILATCIKEQKNYHKALLPVRRRLYAHLFARRIMDKFADKDWDMLITLVSQPRIQKVFQKYSRDNPIPLLFHSFIREPRFLLFVKHLW